MKRENKKSMEERMYDSFTTLLIDRFNYLSEDWSRHWLNAIDFGMPRSLNGRFFSPGNSLMLLLWCEARNWTCPVFVTRKQIDALNKGRAQSECIKIREGQEPFLIPAQQRIVEVYNIAQTNMQQARPDLWEKAGETAPIEGVTRKRNKFYYEPLMHTIKHGTWISAIKPLHQDQSYYSISMDEIVTPEFRQFKKGETFAAICFHEMAHSTGKESVFNRFDEKKGWGITEDYYDREELLAELTSALVCATIGIRKQIKEETGCYLRYSFTEVLKQNPDRIKSLLSDIDKVYTMIFGYFMMMQSVVNAKREESVLIQN